MVRSLSSNVESFGYEAGRSELWVGYRNTRGFYVYEGVPQAVYQALLAAPSKGRFLHRFVLEKFPFRQAP